MALHVINKTETTLWQLLQNAVGPEDTVLLIADAVYAALPSFPLVAAMQTRYPALRFQVLTGDLAARGISAKIRPDFVSVSYQDFVALTLMHERVVNWH